MPQAVLIVITLRSFAEHRPCDPSSAALHVEASCQHEGLLPTAGSVDQSDRRSLARDLVDVEPFGVIGESVLCSHGCC